jgi:hypothetical protein
MMSSRVQSASRPLLFTSIPPRFGGVPLSAASGESVQAVTIRSWHDAGFRPVSVNFSTELAQYPQFEAFLEASGVELCRVEPGRNGAGAIPLVPVVQFLEVACGRAGDSPFAIINADIDVTRSSEQELARRVAALATDAYLLGQRTDCALQDGRMHERVFPFGFDFMAFRGSRVEQCKGLLSPALRLGRPWWDHYVPLALLALGARTMLVYPGWLRHTVHEERWSTQHYVHVGRAAAIHFREAIRRAGDLMSEFGWLDVACGESATPGIPVSLARWIYRAGMHASAPAALSGFLLSRLAQAHMQFILQTAWTGPVPTTGSSHRPPQ